MKSAKEKKSPLELVAEDYFDYIGKHLPQQCASDEFYFLPRSEAAIQQLDILDDLAPEKIQDHIRYVQKLLDEMSPLKQDELEREIDRLLLTLSMRSFIREFDDAEGWRYDPTLYIKIPLFATDRVLSQRDIPMDQLSTVLSTLFAQIPSFLSLAVGNLVSPPEISIEVAMSMVQDVLNFHDRDIRAFIEARIGANKELVARNQEALGAWEKYGRALSQLPSRKSFAIGMDGLSKILSMSLGYPRSPEEVLEIAQHAYQRTQEKIREFAKGIDSRKSWKTIIYARLPAATSPAEVMRLYQREVVNLRDFLRSQDIISFPPGEKVTVLQTPSYLQSLRATASYRAPMTGNAKAHGIFYLTPGIEDLKLISSHCPYLSAHETYPGHHILDYFRIHHANPIRRQIESPLFYEGWATYAEQLLDELGYVQDPRRQLVQLKRQLWRNLRAVLDVEIQTGKTGLVEAAKRIQNLGFSSKRAGRQVRRFALTPGYQLCYYMGTYEIMRLRRQFSSRLGLKAFHDILLGGGQIPFHLVEKRLEARVKERPSNREGTD